jgi:hypothetical protein
MRDISLRRQYIHTITSSTSQITSMNGVSKSCVKVLSSQTALPLNTAWEGCGEHFRGSMRETRCTETGMKKIKKTLDIKKTPH